jgi:hypothetical protein
MKSQRLWAMLYSLLLPFSAGSARASIAYGSINNFDTVNDTDHEAYGFEVELEDCRSSNITYTYDYNHYGVPRITQDDSVAGHPKCIIRWESKKNPDGSWAAYTAIPAGPIQPTDGHMFTNPNVNFGGEHFGAGYSSQPTAIRYNWLIDDGAGNLVHGGAVQVATPAFIYLPPIAGVAGQVQAAIQPPEAPEVHVKQFGDPVWVKEIRTTSHNNRKVSLRDLVSDDPNDPGDRNWRNGEPDEVEAEWKLLQTEFNQAAGGKNGRLEAAPEDLANGDEVVTRRYEFFKYKGPIDNETGEALCDNVGADGIHGSGTGKVNGAEVDFSTVEVVGDYTGAQMAAVDVDASVGLTEHLSDGSIDEPYAARTVVIQGAAPFTASFTGALPTGMTFNAVTGILSGTPAESGEFTCTVKASDANTPEREKIYTFTIAAEGQELPPHSLLDAAADPVAGGSTSGSDSYPVNGNAIVTAVPKAGWRFLQWEEAGAILSLDATFSLTMNVNHSLVAKFALSVPQWNITTSAAPVEGGVTSGGGIHDDRSSVTLTASPNAGYAFVNWTEGGLQVSAAASYTFTAAADRSLTANFAAVPVYTISTSASPAEGGTANGGGLFAQGASVTVTATPAAGFVFVNWKQGTATVSSTPGYTFTVTTSRALTANFIVDTGTRTISTSSSPTEGGAIVGAGTYLAGSECTLAATPNANYVFKRWQTGGTTVSTSANYTFTVSASQAYTARFARIYPVTAISSPLEGGVAGIEGAFEDNDDVTVTASANPGYVFVSWTENGAVVSTHSTWSFRANPARNLVANFKIVGFAVTAAGSFAAGGTVSGGGIYAAGAPVTLTATPARHYEFTGWSANGDIVSTAPAYTFNASAAITVTARFQPVVEITAGAAPKLRWPASAAGWRLQESTDLSSAWADSAAPVNQAGDMNEFPVVMEQPRCFYRLLGP